MQKAHFLFVGLFLITLLPVTSVCHGQDSYDFEQLERSRRQKETKGRQLAEDQAKVGERLRVASSKTVRRFHEVLDELLAEFAYDVKQGQIKGLRNLSIRKVSVSDALPRSYQSYLNLLVTEKIRENSQTTLITCLPCTTKTSTLVEGKLLISSPMTNVTKLEQAAESLGIQYFMDVILVYHTTHMVLAFQVFNTSNKELVWARAYNSETIRSRYQKLAIDYSQIEKSRSGEDYDPEYRVLFGFGGAGVPNVAGTSEDSQMLNFQMRGTERFNNRKSEFGMIFSLYIALKSLVNEFPSESETFENDSIALQDSSEAEEGDEIINPKPFEQAIALHGIYAHNFLDSLESYNKIRYGVNFGVGALFATGYLAPSVRSGLDLYFGRRFATNIGAFYVAPSTIIVDSETIETSGGVGGDLVVSFHF